MFEAVGRSDASEALQRLLPMLFLLIFFSYRLSLRI